MKPMSFTNSLNLEIGTAGDLSKKPLRSTTAQSSASTITTYMTTNTTITSPAITGAKSSTTSSMTASSAAGPVLSVDKGIEFSIEKPKSYQQQNHVFLTEASNNIILANAGSYNGPNLGTAGISGGALKSAVDATPVQLQNYSSVSSLVDRNSYQKNVFQLTGVSFSLFALFLSSFLFFSLSLLSIYTLYVFYLLFSPTNLIFLLF